MLAPAKHGIPRAVARRRPATASWLALGVERKRATPLRRRALLSASPSSSTLDQLLPSAGHSTWREVARRRALSRRAKYSSLAPSKVRDQTGLGGGARFAWLSSRPIGARMLVSKAAGATCLPITKPFSCGGRCLILEALTSKSIPSTSVAGRVYGCDASMANEIYCAA
jgi:hypothetical protein